VRLVRALALVGSAFLGLITVAVAVGMAFFHAWWLASYAAAATLLCLGTWLWAARNRRLALGVAFLAASAVSVARIGWTRAQATTSVSSWRVWRGPSGGGSFVPERDLMAIAARLLPRLWHWPPSAVRDGGFKNAVDRQYAVLDRDPDTRGLESVLLAQVLGTPGAAGHYFLVLPKSPPPEHGYPVVLFLHGFGGNSQLYAGWFRDLAERFGVAAVLPSGSFAGAWWQSGEQVAAWAALEDAGLHHPLDLGRVVVGGLSNGGVGAAKLAKGSRFKGLLAVAAYPSVADAEKGLGGKPAVFLASREDDRFPISGLREAASAFRTAGSAVEVIEIPGDHLAVVKDPAVLGKALEKLCWLGANVCDR
jgi:predicted esterase